MAPMRLPDERDYPVGWYRLAWSFDLPSGSVRPIKLFGTDLVVFRAESGRVGVLDAHCRHLGAHLGFGSVTGDCVQCPFHAWQWDVDGRNQKIPGEPRAAPQRTKAWATHEQSGIVFVWYDPSGSEPQWTPRTILPDGDDAYFDFGPAFAREWEGVRVFPQSIVENVADAAHFKYIHGSHDVPDLRTYTFEGPTFFSTFEYKWGGGQRATWLTPDGPIDSIVHTESWGLGIVVTRYFGIPEVVQVTGATPIEGRTSTIGSAVFVRRPPDTSAGDEVDPIRRRLAEHLLAQPEHDLVVWEHMAMVERPLLRKDEARIYNALREWASQFYVADIR